jgi:hypothetical protein
MDKSRSLYGSAGVVVSFQVSRSWSIKCEGAEVGQTLQNLELAEHRE